MAAKTPRIPLLAALLALRSPRTILLAVGGVAFLAYTQSLPTTPFHIGLYASLIAAVSLYRITLPAKGFKEYITSAHGCPAAATALSLGGGVTAAILAAAIQAPLSLLPTTQQNPLTIASAATWGLVLGAPITALITAAGTTLPLIAILYATTTLASNTHSPNPTVLALITTIAAGALSITITCRRRA